MCMGSVLCCVAAANKLLRYKMIEQSSTRMDGCPLSGNT